MSNVERVRKSIPAVVARKLWVASGGRCQYNGCNISLLEDSLTKRGINKSYISHIIAASPNGPRGQQKLSRKLELDFHNLLLLCDECHNRIDEADIESHSVERLRKMKSDHEARIALLTSLTPEKRTHVVFLGANIGIHNSPLVFKDAVDTILPDRFPFESKAIVLSQKQVSFYDNEDEYWLTEPKSLKKQFENKISHLKEDSDIQHYSIFALAPQSLLIQFGTLLNDIYEADIYQLHREPKSWKWMDEDSTLSFKINNPDQQKNQVALKLELSATINDERIISVVGKDTSIWSFSIDNPNNDCIRTKEDLKEFRVKIRVLLNKIKAFHGENVELSVFPAMPISAAIELGRVWMPKADLPMIIFDQNRMKNGFFKTIEIKCK